MSHRHLYKSTLLHGLTPLIAGALIYICFRPGLLLSRYFTQFRVDAGAGDSWWMKVLIFNVPDFLWSYSFASILFILNKNYRSSTAFNVLSFSLLVGSEVVQLLFPASFTFDLIDLFAAVLAFFMSYLFIYKYGYE